MSLSHYSIALLSLLLLLTACEEDNVTSIDQGHDFDRAAMLADMGAVISESYTSYHAQTEVLNTAVSDFVASPSTSTLSELRNQWTATLLSWQKVAIYDFGPAAEIALEAKTNIYPVSSTLIESNVNGGDYTLQGASNRTAIGLQAIDYLIYGQDMSVQDVLASFGEDSMGQNRRAYLSELSALVTNTALNVAQQWNDGSELRSGFATNDGTDQGSSLGLYLNAFNRSLEKSTRTNKIGIPAGALTFSMSPMPETVEAFFQNDRSVSYLRASVEAFEQAYLGTDTHPVSLDDYLVAIDARHGDSSLDKAIKDRFDSIYESIDRLQDPLADFVVSDQEQVMETFAELQAMVVLLKVDMMSSLGILITYQDNDGD